MIRGIPELNRRLTLFELKLRQAGTEYRFSTR